MNDENSTNIAGELGSGDSGCGSVRNCRCPWVGGDKLNGFVFASGAPGRESRILACLQGVQLGSATIHSQPKRNCSSNIATAVSADIKRSLL